jgi:hypothetical protein
VLVRIALLRIILKTIQLLKLVSVKLVFVKLAFVKLQFSNSHLIIFIFDKLKFSNIISLKSTFMNMTFLIYALENIILLFPSKEIFLIILILKFIYSKLILEPIICELENVLIKQVK